MLKNRKKREKIKIWIFGTLVFQSDTVKNKCCQVDKTTLFKENMKSR